VALPGDKSAAVIVELSEASANTVIAIVKCVRGKGAGPKTPRVQAVIFRPGDPLQSEARCDIESADRGDTVTFSQVHLPDGARAGERKAVVRVQEGVTPTRIDPNEFRAPYAFTPYGELIYEMDPSDIKISDENSKGAWSTQLPHGRIQPSNRETGYYGTAEMGAVKTRDNIVRLQSERLEAAMDLGDPLRTYPFMAAVLSAKKHRDLHFTYGAVEWEARMPDRTGTWPALWLLPSSGWPPEIDVYEGFSHNPEWTPAVGLSSALHGGKSSEGIKRAFVRGGFRMQMGDFGLKGDLTDEFHKFQARVTPKWITIFVDDVETMRYANPFRGTTWFPLMTIAVKAEADDPFDQGSGAMDIRSLKIWRAED
jgi:beta-glucanase (GH16 family)